MWKACYTMDRGDKEPDGLGEYEQLPPTGLEAEANTEFEKPPVCDRCSQRERCWGVRRGYVSLYGSSELRAFQPEPPSDGAT